MHTPVIGTRKYIKNVVLYKKTTAIGLYLPAL